MYQVDVYLRVRRAVMVDGMSIREVSRVFGLHRDTVRKILAYSVPPGYRRQTSPRRPKLEPFTGVIDQILADVSMAADTARSWHMASVDWRRAAEATQPGDPAPRRHGKTVD